MKWVGEDEVVEEVEAPEQAEHGVAIVVEDVDGDDENSTIDEGASLKGGADEEEEEAAVMVGHWMS